MAVNKILAFISFAEVIDRVLDKGVVMNALVSRYSASQSSWDCDAL